MQQIRSKHTEIKQLSNDRRASKLTTQQIQQEIKHISEQLQTSPDNPDNQEITQYMQQYFQLLDVLNDIRNKSIKKQDFDQRVSQIFKTQTQIKHKTPQASQNQQNLQIKPEKRSSLIQKRQNGENISYFASKIPRNHINSFRSIINEPVLPNNQNFKKKHVGFKHNQMIHQNPITNSKIQQQIQNMKRQNKELKTILETNQSNEELNVQFRQKIGQLQNYISQLQNAKIKCISQLQNGKTKCINAYIPIYPPEQEPYVLHPRSNDLKQLTQKSQSRFNKNQRSDIILRNNASMPISAILSNNIFKKSVRSKTEYEERENSEIRPMSNNFKYYSQPQPEDFQLLETLVNIQSGSYFDSFSLHSQNYSKFDIVGNQRYGISDPLTCTRNKVAFFKNSLRIVTDKQFQIAFKRSQLNLEQNQLRLIFYVKNKTSKIQTVSIDYQQQCNYMISIEEKMDILEPYSQGRQVIFIKNKNNQELDSIIDANFLIGQRVYNLWVPANFIKFDYCFRRVGGMTKLMSLIPDKYFQTYEQAIKVLPLANKQQGYLETSAYLYGRSSCHDGGIKLTWSKERKLKIETSEKWISYVCFLLCKNM